MYIISAYVFLVLIMILIVCVWCYFKLKGYKNLVIITSVIHTTSNPLSYSSVRSFQSPAERLEDTFKTIKSVREKIPDPFIVIIEGSVLTKEEEYSLYNTGCDNIHNVAKDLQDIISGPHKSVAEASMLVHFLNRFYIKNRTSYATLSKISGRYYLSDNFVWNKYPLDKALFQCESDNRCNTRYYRIPIEYLHLYEKVLKEALRDPRYMRGEIDIEEYNIFRVFPNHIRIMKNHEVLGVKGYIAPTGQFVEDFTI